MKDTLKRLLLVLALIGFAACTMKPPENDAVSPGVQPVLAESNKERIAAPATSTGELAELVEGNQAFALDLYHYLASQEEGNLFLSPHSISVALAMTYAGARGETESQMAETLHFMLSQEQLHPAFNKLDLTLAERGYEGPDADAGGFRLSIVNALWGQQGYEFRPAFLDTLAQNYGAGMRLVDFASDAGSARQNINDWVSTQTEQRIEDLIPQDGLDELTRLVLTNAIYFNAAWATPFEEHMTEDGPFYLLDGGSVGVPMMGNTTERNYASGPGYQVVELPYEGYEFSMILLLPEEGDFEGFEASLDQAKLAAILNELSSERVALTMPKFEMQSRFSLSDALIDLAMPVAFSMQADFSGMDGTKDLLISKVFHQTFVSVDEEGTEAAGATAVVMTLKAVMPEPAAEVTVDRPFVFAIRDIETGALLFIGRVMDPS